MIEKFRTFLSGKKTYITAAIGVLGALAAFADHQIDLPGLLAALWAAAQTVFMRAAVEKAVNNQNAP